MMADQSDRTAQRIAALQETELPDSPPASAYDWITAMAARLLGAPIALVSLVDRERQFLRSAVGLPEPLASQGATPIAYSYCKHAVERREPLVIHDSLEDPLVRDNPATTELGIRSYAGVPLFAPGGEAVGTLCVADTEPRQWTDDDVELLRGLADGVQCEIALRRELRRIQQAERAVEEAEERYRTLVDALPVIIYLAEPLPPYSPIYVSPAAASLGYAVGEWTASPALWVRLLHPEDRDRVIAEMQAALSQGAPTDCEYRVVTAGGEIRWIHDRGHFVLNADGNALYRQGVMVDITPGKAAEAALQEQRKELRQVIDVVPHLLFAKDEHGRYLLANQAFASIYDRTPAEIVGRTDAEIGVDPAEAEIYLAEEQEVMRSGQPQPVSAYPRRGRDGEQRVYEVLKVPFRRAGTDRPAVLGLVRDVTGEREQAHQLQRAQRLASVGTLIGGVAHELNNPLSAIKGLSQLLLMDAVSEDDRESLETIHRESDRMARIVADLRRLARESHEAEAPRVALDLNEVVKHVLQLRGYSLSTHNIEVIEDLQPDLEQIMADPGRMEQVVLNLVVNAEQAMVRESGHGRLTITTRSGKSGVLLRVDDNGPGIASEHQESIFDPFWTTKAPGEGTGLGLSLIHGIVASMGGTISVDSAPLRGAAFTVLIPRSAKEPVAAPIGETPRHAAERPPSAALRILVVDDEAAVRTTLVRYLKRRGHQVVEASDGGDALAQLENAHKAQTQFDAIISDLRMPGLDGSELLKRLREQGQGMDRRLLFLTGDDASPDAEELLNDSGVPVMLKPFDFGRLEEVIQRVAEGGAAADTRMREDGSRLHERTGPTLRSFLARLRTDPGIQDTLHLGDADLEDHTCMLIAGIAQALVIPDGSVADREALLADGQRALDTVSDLHGVQRSRIGWTEASLAREYQILEEEIASAIGQGRDDVPESPTIVYLRAVLVRAHGVALSSLQRERGT